jgi:catechol 2,3-dioxygenase-like lactoylglutathione lyase family enzyme
LPCALISSDVEQTIGFYQGVLEFPLTEIMENRDTRGSTHFFFDVGNGNLLAFFDFPGLGLGDPDGVRVELTTDPLGEMGDTGIQ